MKDTKLNYFWSNPFLIQVHPKFKMSCWINTWRYKNSA